MVEKYDNIPLNVKLSILDEVCLGLRYLHSRNPSIEILLIITFY